MRAETIPGAPKIPKSEIWVVCDCCGSRRAHNKKGLEANDKKWNTTDLCKNCRRLADPRGPLK